MLVQQAIVRHMRTNIGDHLWENHIDINNVMYRGGIESYITVTRMESNGAWGSEVEIFALAHLLNVPTYEYFGSIKRWHLYTPLAVCGFMGLSQYDNSSMAMYIRLSRDHYDVVSSVKSLTGSTLCEGK